MLHFRIVLQLAQKKRKTWARRPCYGVGGNEKRFTLFVFYAFFRGKICGVVLLFLLADFGSDGFYSLADVFEVEVYLCDVRELLLSFGQVAELFVATA